MSDQPTYRVHICHGPNCTPRGGAKALIDALEREVERLGIGDRVEILATSCRNRCERGPSVNVYPGPVTYGFVTPDAMAEIAWHHLVLGNPVEKYVVEQVATNSIDFSKLDNLFKDRT
jgi:(2Fe-2S) ferredoxin